MECNEVRCFILNNNRNFQPFSDHHQRSRLKSLFVVFLQNLCHLNTHSMYKTTENHVSIHLVPFISSCCSYWLCLLFVVVFLSLCLLLKSCFVADDGRERLKIPIVIENKTSNLIAFHSTALSLIFTEFLSGHLCE